MSSSFSSLLHGSLSYQPCCAHLPTKGGNYDPPKYVFWQVLNVARIKLAWNSIDLDLNPRAFPPKLQKLELCRLPPYASVSPFVIEVRGTYTEYCDMLSSSPSGNERVYCLSCQECCHLLDLSCQSLWGCFSCEKSKLTQGRPAFPGQLCPWPQWQRLRRVILALGLPVGLTETLAQTVSTQLLPLPSLACCLICLITRVLSFQFPRH